MFSVSALNTNGYSLNQIKASDNSGRIYGPFISTSLSDRPFLVSHDALKSTPTFVVELASWTTARWGIMYECLMGVFNSSMWPSLRYSAINLQYSNPVEEKDLLQLVSGSAMLLHTYQSCNITLHQQLNYKSTVSIFSDVFIEILFTQSVFEHLFTLNWNFLNFPNSFYLQF